MGDNEIDDDKNEGKSLAISIAMAMQQYNAGHIAPDRARPGLHWKPLVKKSSIGGKQYLDYL